ncbi:MAG: insulinase family protein, partial [Eubacteriales bacterium]
GSKPYPVKEPFLDLLKSSINTFLNAFTFPDKTMYPCASCNDTDFANLMGVYLDAVFAPNIYTYKEIFMQEGWHYEVENADDPLTYRGVVFNEMKGSYSSVETHVYEHLKQALFPDTLYRHSSGGDPVHIPDLTYEQFLNAHRKYYHPENSFLYLYGKMDIEERLAYIDREYLSSFTRTGTFVDIPMQSPVVNMDVTGEYAVGESDPLEKNSYISHAFVVGRFDEAEKMLALRILSSALASTNESPLKKAVLAAGLGDDLYVFLNDGIAQPYLEFQLCKCDADKKDAFLALLTSELEKYVREGIDKKILLAEINQTEFHLREGKQGGMPAGLSYGLDIMDGWLYGGRPETYLVYEDAIANIRKGVEGRYFEDLIEKYVLNGTHKALVVITPSKTKGQEDAKAEALRLEEHKKSLSHGQIEDLIAENQKLIEHQKREDTPEQIATLPRLSLSDVKDEITPLPLEKRELGGYPVLWTNIPTKKIAYLNYYFDLSSLAPEYRPYAPLYADLLGQIATEHYSAADLDAEIKTKMGAFSTFTQVFTDRTDIDKVTPVLTVRISVLESGLADAVALAGEILTASKPERETVGPIVLQTKNWMQQNISQRGDSFAITRVKSYHTVDGAYNELFGGISYYRFLSDLCDKIKTDYDSVQKGFAAVADCVKAENLTVGLTGEESAYNLLAASLPVFERGEKKPAAPAPVPVYTENEAFIVPAGVNYVVSGCNFIKEGLAYSGSMQVLSRILTYDYLWNEIRVRGGAYGTGFSTGFTGDVLFSSYRDPNVGGTLENYRKTVDYLAGFSEKVPDITQYIISTLAGSDRPLTPKDKGSKAQSYYFQKVTEDFRRQVRHEILSTTPADIEAFGKLIQTVCDKRHFAVVGNKSRIEEAGDAFPKKEEV